MNGIYTSPTGAVGVAGALKAQHRGRCVCIVTDSGLKSNLMLEGLRSRIFRVEDEGDLERFIEEFSEKR